MRIPLAGFLIILITGCTGRVPTAVTAAHSAHQLAPHVSKVISEKNNSSIPSRRVFIERENNRLALEAQLHECKQRLAALSPLKLVCAEGLPERMRDINLAIKAETNPEKIRALEAEKKSITDLLTDPRGEYTERRFREAEQALIEAELQRLNSRHIKQSNRAAVSKRLEALRRARIEELFGEIGVVRHEAMKLGIGASASPHDGPDTTLEEIEASLKIEMDPAKVADLKERKTRLLDYTAAAQKVIENLKRLEVQKALLDAQLERDPGREKRPSTG